MTAQEDNAILESFLRGAVAKLVDFRRIILMRTAANFDRAPPGMSDLTQLLYVDQGGFGESARNIYNAGHYIVDNIVANWNAVYKKGIKVTNYVGDIFDSLPGPFPPDIGYVILLILLSTMANLMTAHQARKLAESLGV